MDLWHNIFVLCGMKTCTRKTQIEFFGKNSSNQFAPHSKDKMIYWHYCCIVLKQMFRRILVSHIYSVGGMLMQGKHTLCVPHLHRLTVKDIESTPVLDKCFLKWIWLQSGCLHKYKYSEIQIRYIIGLWVVGTSGKWEALWPPGCEDTTS